MLIVGVVICRGKGWGNVGLSETTANFDSVTRFVVCIGQIAERRGALLVRQRRRFGGDVVNSLSLQSASLTNHLICISNHRGANKIENYAKP